MPLLAMDISTVPGGSSRVMALPISAMVAAAAVTEMPGARRTYSVSMDSSISGKNVVGRRDAVQPAPTTRTSDAPMTAAR